MKLTVPGRCHFDGNGWLQGPIRIAHLFTPNHGTGFGTGRGVVMHTEAGFEAGTVATFMNRANGVSAFFSIAQDGSCHQYLPVGKGYSGWSQVAGNDSFRGIEDEDRTHPSIPLTTAQLATFAQIFEACSEFDGFPLQITDSPSGQGLILHSDGGQEWGGHLQCPGPVRGAQRHVIVALAKAIRAGTSPTPQPSVRTWTTAGQLTFASLCQQELKELPSTVLRVTLQNSVPTGTFGPLLASYLNAVFNADTEIVPAETTWAYPGGEWTAQGELSLAALCQQHLEALPAQVLALTATRSRGGAYEPNVASYINSVIGRSVLKPPAGMILHY